ncbi:MAG: AIR synthase-related protein, partial [Chromatiales bacterium]|nr:AIR synthase-related protein [Chromatiales bacterium]
YLDQGCSPGGAQRNFDSYGDKIGELTERQRQLLCDPQTSGGLLVAVTSETESEFLKMARDNGFNLEAIGELTNHRVGAPLVEVH